MKLKDYLKENKINSSQFAEMIGTSKNQILNLRSWKKPGPKMAAKIYFATNGAVTVEELLFPNGELAAMRERLSKNQGKEANAA